MNYCVFDFGPVTVHIWFRYAHMRFMNQTNVGRTMVLQHVCRRDVGLETPVQGSPRGRYRLPPGGFAGAALGYAAMRSGGRPSEPPGAPQGGLFGSHDTDHPEPSRRLRLIPTRADPHALAQSRRPMDMMSQG